MTTPSPFYLAWVAHKGRPPTAADSEEFRTAMEFYLTGYEQGIELAKDIQRPFVEGVNSRLDALTQQVFDLVGSSHVPIDETTKETQEEGLPQGGV